MSTDTDTINHHRLIISIINIYLLRYRCSVDLSMMGDVTQIPADLSIFKTRIWIMSCLMQNRGPDWNGNEGKTTSFHDMWHVIRYLSNKASVYYLQIFILSRSGYLLTYIPTAVKRMLKRRPRRGSARCRTSLRHLSTLVWNLHNFMFLHLHNM